MNPTVATPAGPLVLVMVRNQLFGVSLSHVLEMMSMPLVTAVPGHGSDVRGVINLRGQVLPLLDLRRRLGMPSAHDELNDLLTIFAAREQDHRRWIDELEASLREQRPFALTTDPHKCAFGRWYDGLQTTNVVLAGQLQKIDAPHKLIHERGAAAIERSRQGDWAGGLAIAEEIRTKHLTVTLARFEETRVVLREAQREIAVVLCDGERRMAIAVDGVESVERIGEADLHALDAGLVRDPTALATSVGKRTKDGRLVLLLDATQLFVN